MLSLLTESKGSVAASSRANSSEADYITSRTLHEVEHRTSLTYAVILIPKSSQVDLSPYRVELALARCETSVLHFEWRRFALNHFQLLYIVIKFIFLGWNSCVSQQSHCQWKQITDLNCFGPPWLTLFSYYKFNISSLVTGSNFNELRCLLNLKKV